MKQILIILCIIAIIIPCIVYGVAIFKGLSMSSNCIEYLSLAADANNTVMAERHLTSARCGSCPGPKVMCPSFPWNAWSPSVPDFAGR